MKMILTIFVFLPSLCSAACLSSNYTVPVPEHLQEFAFYPIEIFGYRQTQNDILISYHLPIDLTGAEDRVIVLKGVSESQSTFVVSDQKNHHKGTCTIFGERISCLVAYGNLHLEGMGPENFLQRKYFDSPELLNGKLNVLKIFRGDPVGVLNLEGCRNKN